MLFSTPSLVLCVSLTLIVLNIFPIDAASTNHRGDVRPRLGQKPVSTCVSSNSPITPRTSSNINDNGISPKATPFQFYATTVDGLEKILSDEIRTLPDVYAVTICKCGVKYTGSVRTGLASLMQLRTALKIMECIGEQSNIVHKADLYDFASVLDWQAMMQLETTFKCSATVGRVSSNELSHSHFTALTIKNAVTDYFRASTGARPSIDIEDPDLPLHLYLHNEKATLYRVWSGDRSLHKRGYRDVVHKAALRETTAAAMCVIWTLSFCSFTIP